MSKSKFELDLENLVAVEIAETVKHRDANRCAALLELLGRSVGLGIAIAGRGKPENIDKLLKNVTGHVETMAKVYGQMGTLITAEPEEGERLQ